MAIIMADAQDVRGIRILDLEEALKELSYKPLEGGWGVLMLPLWDDDPMENRYLEDNVYEPETDEDSADNENISAILEWFHAPVLLRPCDFNQSLTEKLFKLKGGSEYRLSKEDGCRCVYVLSGYPDSMPNLLPIAAAQLFLLNYNAHESGRTADFLDGCLFEVVESIKGLVPAMKRVDAAQEMMHDALEKALSAGALDHEELECTLGYDSERRGVSGGSIRTVAHLIDPSGLRIQVIDAVRSRDIPASYWGEEYKWRKTED